MSSGALSLALAAGVLSVLNPCAVALLPAWIARLSEQRSRGEDDLLGRTGAGVRAGLAVSAGFAIFFVPLGIIASLTIERATTSLPWLGAALGVTLMLIGLWMTAGRKIARLPLPTASRQAHGETGGLVAYGLAYATTALGCSFPTFLLAVGLQSGRATTGVALRVLAFATGATIVLVTISIIVVLAAQTPTITPLAHAVSKLTPALLVLTGAFMAAHETRLALAAQGTQITPAIVPLSLCVAATALAIITIARRSRRGKRGFARAAQPGQTRP